ncbi:facilitated trehalose transporter Tret1-like isoform X2 [Planococcus citri]|uniref:facilitated trehalose transporter Tret1-like isoform X2 n=1 Tax=Planococcus citri TaxID=170843 RepID=UPI0031F8EE9F
MEAAAEKGFSNGNAHAGDNLQISTFRRALPQFLATSAKNLILMDLGMTLAFPTLVIAALLKSKSGLHFDDAAASWFGSIPFICQPIGSIISGTVLEPLGRKKSMLLVNIPHFIGWYLFYTAISLPVLFLAAILMGLGVGFMEAPVITYVGEISEPKLRGVLTSYSGIFVTIGLIVEFLLGTLYDWNTAAFISCFVPIVTFVAITQVPETPMWLLSKGRVKEAEKSLQWLRGWVPASLVQNELNELIRYSDASKLVLKDKPSIKQTANNKENSTYSNPVNLEDELPNGKKVAENNPDVITFVNGANGVIINTPAPPTNNNLPTENTSLEGSQRKATVAEILQDLIRPQMRRPFFLVIAFFVFHNGSGFPAMRPYMVNIFQELRFPVDANWATVIISCIGFLGVIVCTVSVGYVGKRTLTLGSMAGCASSTLGLSVWSLLNENSPDKSLCWTPFILFILLSFSFSFGLAPIPWMILSEVFPFRGRGFASGCAAAVSYILGFITAKTFLDLKSTLSLSGVFSLYGSITVTGIVYVYFKLPETEGKSLQDIEKFYNEKKVKK